MLDTNRYPTGNIGVKQVHNRDTSQSGKSASVKYFLNVIIENGKLKQLNAFHRG